MGSESSSINKFLLDFIKTMLERRWKMSIIVEINIFELLLKKIILSYKLSLSSYSFWYSLFYYNMYLFFCLISVLLQHIEK